MINCFGSNICNKPPGIGLTEATPKYNNILNIIHEVTPFSYFKHVYMSINSGNFICDFVMDIYPFDVQRCEIIMKMDPAQENTVR
jgi:hypothetical protein